MKKAIFVVEGQTEQIFVERFIKALVALQPCYVTLEKLHGDSICLIGTRGSPIEFASHFIRIINAQGDDRVNSFIEDRLDGFVEKGFRVIYGLRDRYTGDGNKRVDFEKISAYFSKISAERNIIVNTVVAIDEIEAWFLAVPKFFRAYDDSLILEKINECLGYDLSLIDIESIEHPAMEINKVLMTVGTKYRKHADDSHKIANELDYDTLYLERTNDIPALSRFTAALETILA